MNELALFAGAGGGILAGHMLGWRTVCAVERDAYAAQVLAQRQNDGALRPFPIWADVCSFDGRPWRELVDVVSGGFPCQDISVAGRGAGIEGARSGMWGHMARIIGEVRPWLVYVENSPALVTRGLGRVLGDLASLGYDCRWTVLGAADVGAPHQRDRFWLVAWGADRDHERAERKIQDARHDACGADVADADSAQREGRRLSFGAREENADIGSAGWWLTEPDVGRVAHGVAARVDRLKAIGNGQVPVVAACSFRGLR
jgi:DNA (cytosine-5)-methyltransferase 1